MSTKTLIGIAVGAVVILLGGAWASNVLLNRGAEADGDPDIIARQGLHTHPVLSIYVNGERQPVPANIGVGPQYAGRPTYDPGMRMTAIHTHESDGTIHLEFPGVVRQDDLRLGNFFEVWGKEFSGTQLFGHVNGPEGEVHMSVNGEPNTEYEEYAMQDGDRIEIRYE